MKLLIQYPQYGGVGGISRYLDGFLANLSSSTRKDIAMLTSDWYGKKAVGIKTYVIPIQKSKIGEIIWSKKAAKICQKLYDDGTIDVVNLHFPPLLTCLFMANLPYITTAHTTYYGLYGGYTNYKYFNQSNNRIDTFFRYKLEKHILSKSSKIVTLTEQGKDELGFYNVDMSKVYVCPNGVDTKKFACHKRKKSIDCLFMGRIEERKGSKDIVPICKSLVRKKPDIKIAIVGYGPDQKYIMDSLTKERKAGNVLMPGRVSFNNATDYYSKSKVYVSTSCYEGLPGTCLEAMSVGLPVVVWRMPFYKKLVQNGVNGYCIGMKDNDKMVNSIINLLNDPVIRSSMSEKNVLKVVEKYDWELLARNIARIMFSK